MAAATLLLCMPSPGESSLSEGMLAAFGGDVVRDRRLVRRLDVERHDLSSGDVLLHVAVEEPEARIRHAEADDGPASAPQSAICAKQGSSAQ